MRLAAALLALAAAAAPGWGQESASLEELVTEALRNNPQIAAAQKQYEAARQRPTQESTLPDPMLSLGYNSTGSPRPLAGLGDSPAANAGFMVTQEFPFPGKLKLRGEIADAEARAGFQAFQQVQLDVVSRLKQAYYKLHYAWAAGDVLERNRDLLTKLLQVTEARYSVGRAAQQDVFKAQTQLSIIETRLLQVAQEKETLAAEINRLLNRPAGRPLARPREVEPKPLALSVENLYASARESSPMLQREQKMVERAELSVNLARKDFYPDYSVTAGYYNMGSMPPISP